MLKFISRQQVDAYFDRVATTLAELSPHMLEARHPDGSHESYDYAGLLAMGIEGLFAPMAAHQPRAHAALMARSPEILVAELTTTDPIGRKTWNDDAFVGSGEHYVRVAAAFRGESIAAAGERSVLWTRYASLPPAIAQAYYFHANGLELVHQLPGNPYQSRGLPARLDVWLRADQVGGSGRKQLNEIKQGFAAIADPDAPPRRDGLVWRSFACVLDSREQDDSGSAGDLLFVQEQSPSQRMFHVHDGNFAAIRQVDDPVGLYDEYVAWVFSGGAGTFDFCLYSRPA